MASFVHDEPYVERMMVKGEVTIAEAEKMVRRGSLTRNLCDNLLFRICVHPLGEASEHASMPEMYAFALLSNREPEAAVEGIAPAVAAALDEATRALAGSSYIEGGKAVLRALAVPYVDERKQALALFARTSASRINDGLSHPAVGAAVMAWPTILDQDDKDMPEVAAILTMKQLSAEWTQMRAHRSAVEQAIRNVAISLPWPDREDHPA